MPHPKFTFAPLIIGLLLAVCPLFGQNSQSDWLSELEYSAEGLVFPVTATNVEINGETISLADSNGRKVAAVDPGLH
ncbi:MAG: Na+/H+ antiporter NhaC family protein, partial [Bacteroidota bacterium]